MRGPHKVSTAVRKPDGTIEVFTEPVSTLAQKHSIFSLPFFRGIGGLYDSLTMGTRALNYSAAFIEEEEPEGEKEGLVKRIFGDRSEKIEEGLTMAIAVLIAVGLFMILPTAVTNLFKDRFESTVMLNLIEGLIRIALFLGYVVVVSRIDDIHRVFQYHGAEHKTIHCYERGDELTVENVKKYTTLHPRCGTSFLFTVMLVSILVLSFFGWPNPILRLVIRLLMIPVILGLSYEINRLLARMDNPLSKIMVAPGLFIQKIATVKEPDDGMIEVAIAALKEVVPEDPEEDVW